MDEELVIASFGIFGTTEDDGTREPVEPVDDGHGPRPDLAVTDVHESRKVVWRVRPRDGAKGMRNLAHVKGACKFDEAQ